MSKQHSWSDAQLGLLKSLKKHISRPQPSMTKKQQPTKQPIYSSPQAESQSDSDLFRQAMQGVQPIQHNNIAPARQTKKPLTVDAQMLAKRAAAEGIDQHDHAELSDTQAMLNPVSSEAFLSYKITTLQNKVFEDLKAGKLHWFDAVDLHGCTIEQAREAVLQLIRMAKRNNETVIKIVHGKGPSAILKTCVNGWLRQHRDVLAFVSAPAHQGGTGSVLVLLKRNEKKSKPQDENK